MVQLIVSNEPLDMSEKPSMSFQVQDIADIESRQGDYTYEFSVPDTQKNRRLLKRSHYIYGAPYQYIEAWFRTSSDVKKGFIQVAEYDGEFKVNFFAGNSNWISLIGEKLLSDLDLTRFNHIYSRANVVNSFSRTEGYIYPYMKAESGFDRELYVGKLGSLNTSTSDWISFDDLSGDFYNQGKYEAPFYTADEDYSISVVLYLDVTAISGSTTIGIYKRGGGINYQGLDTQSVNSTGQYTFRWSGELEEGISIGSYLLIASGSITIGTNSYLAISTSFVDLENINFRDLTPAMYVHSVVKTIFQEIGFKMTGSFLQNADYNRMIIPFSGSTFGISDAVAIDKSIFVGLTGTFQANSPEEAIFWSDFSSPYYINTVSLFPNPSYQADGDYSVDIEVNLVVEDSGGSADIEIRKNGTDILSELATDGLHTVSTTVTSGDTITVYITTGTYLDLGVNTYFKVTGINNIVENTEVIASGLLPDMKQIDLIKYLFVTFGIIPEVDDFSNTIKMTEFRQVRQNATEDWSQKYLSEYELDFYDFSSNYNRLNNFNYKSYDDDRRMENYLSRNKRAYGDGFIELENIFLMGEGTLFENEFVATWFDEITVLEESAHICNFVRDKEPRILFVVPNALVADFASFTEINIDDEAYAVTNIAWAYFTKHKLGTDLDNFTTNLAYTMPTILNPNGFGMLSKYWDDYAGVLSRPKLLKATFRLTLKDIITLDYTKRKYIEAENITGYYFLNRIRSYDYDSNIAECELVLIDDLDLEDEAILTTQSEETPSDLILQEQNDFILQEQNDFIEQQ